MCADSRDFFFLNVVVREVESFDNVGVGVCVQIRDFLKGRSVTEFERLDVYCVRSCFER